MAEGQKPNVTFSAPVGSFDLPAEDYKVYACDNCLPWHAEAFADDDGMVWVREWHAVDCPAFQELLAIADEPGAH